MSLYITEKTKLQEIYNKAREELALKLRPEFFKTFQTFFGKYPEVASFKFKLDSSVYDDENYNSEVDYVNFELHPEFTTEDFINDNDWCQYEDTALNMKAHSVELGELFSSVERVREVSKAVLSFGRNIAEMDYEFLADLFGDNAEVTVNNKGFEVTK